MEADKPKGRSWVRIGCLTLVGIGVILGLVAAGAAGITLVQNRNATVEISRFEEPIPENREAPAISSPHPSGSDAKTVGLVQLDIAAAQLTINPGPAGSAIGISAIYDTNRFVLENETSEDETGRWKTRISLRPLGSEAWELVRMKIGGNFPRIRIALPRDVPFELTGDLRKAFAAVELGGLWVRSTDLEVDSGGLNLSFIEPLREPMRSLEVNGSGGAMQVMLLGNASPISTSLVQRFGGVDLDMRGGWMQDGHIYLETKTAGGSVWLPSDVRIEGLGRPPSPLEPRAEIDRPTLQLELVNVHRSQVVLID